MNRTILLVDDDNAIRESLRKVLQADGYTLVSKVGATSLYAYRPQGR